MKIALIVTMMLLGTACNKEVAFDTLETARLQAKDNALWNAQNFRASDPRYKEGFDLVVRGDSTQMPECPQGDGWASVDLIAKDNKANVVKLKCSTVSSAVGCMTSVDFEQKAYAQEESHCQSTNKVPFPFRKIAQ